MRKSPKFLGIDEMVADLESVRDDVQEALDDLSDKQESRPTDARQDKIDAMMERIDLFDAAIAALEDLRSNLDS